MSSLRKDLQQLLASQLQEWPFAKKNFEALQSVQLKVFQFDGFEVKVQFNPSRIVSSGAKLDAKTIKERKCFLCTENRPVEQKSLQFGDELVLVNPFPIFKEHFTIPQEKHKPQLIRPDFDKILNWAEQAEGYTVFYNGPKCGASAPDHFHFQMAVKNVMPLDYQLNDLKSKYGKQSIHGQLELWAINDGLRNFFVLESSEKVLLKEAFFSLFALLEKHMPSEDEPPMNIVAFQQNGKINLVVFPRANQRPSQYFADGDEHIMVSPASVEMSGLLITPLEKDFNKITIEDIQSIFRQVSVDKELFQTINEKLITVLELLDK